MVYSELMETNSIDALNDALNDAQKRVEEHERKMANIVNEINAQINVIKAKHTHNNSGSLVDDIFGGSLKQWRELRDLTQEAVTAKMVERGFDFHQSTLYKIESGKRRVLLGEGMALAEILDVPLSKLTEPDVNSEPSLLASIKFSAKLEIDAIYRALNGLVDVFTSSSGLAINISYLEEVAGDKKYDFDGVTSTARDFYEPLSYKEVKPMIGQLEKLLESTKQIREYLKP
jgi:transcriptional regulator with XRE-family HTH domain